MALFSKHPVQIPDPQPVGYSVVDAQTSIDGDVETETSLRIDGRLRGNVRSAGVLVVAAGASVHGAVAAREVIVGGRIIGNVTATERVELQQSSAITGDIEASAIMIQEGGTVDGRLTIRPTSAPAVALDRVVEPGDRRLQAALGGSAG